MKQCFILFLFFIMGCQANCFENVYNDEEIETSTYIPRKWKEDVKIIDTFDLPSTLKRYEKDYVILGTSHFNGRWCSRSLLVDFAKKQGATLVIVGIKLLNSNIKKMYVNIPIPNTSYHSGTVSGNGFQGHYSGTSTYYTTSTAEFPLPSYNFEQRAFFMAKRKVGVIND